MAREHLPVYQIKDFKDSTKNERYIYVNFFANHLQEHLFVREPHKHAFYIIILITKGTGTHIIDFKKYEVQPNIVFFLKPGQVHSWELSADADGLVIFFTSEFYLNEFPDRKLYDFPFFNALLYQPILHISETEKAGLHQTFEALHREFLHQEQMRNQMLGSYLNIMLIGLARVYNTKSQKVEMQGGELVLLQTLEQLTEQHFKEHLPVTFYSEKLNITTRHLNEICKRSL